MLIIERSGEENAPIQVLRVADAIKLELWVGWCHG